MSSMSQLGLTIVDEASRIVQQTSQQQIREFHIQSPIDSFLGHLFMNILSNDLPPTPGYASDLPAGYAKKMERSEMFSVT